MFLLALLALSVLALLPAFRASAIRNKAAIRAADREGMPAQSQTNHPAHRREARLANDASSPAARPAVSPASESDDLETSNTTNLPAMKSLPPSASPAPSLGLALGVSRDRAGQPLSPCESGAHGPDLLSCTASPRPRITCGDAARTGAASARQPALTCWVLGPAPLRGSADCYL